jgi:WD40 repeat-containing protein SMU1
VRVWDGKTCDCLTSFRPPQALGGSERAVLDVHLNPQNVDHIIVCTRSSTVFIMTLQGQAGHPFPLFLLRWRAPHLYKQTVHKVLLFSGLWTKGAFKPSRAPQVVKSFQSGKREGGDFVASWVSPRGEWIYCLGEDGILYCFSVATGNLEHLLQVCAYIIHFKTNLFGIAGCAISCAHVCTLSFMRVLLLP